MIQHIEKLNGCKPKLLEIAKYLEGIFSEVIITSGKRSLEENSRCGGAKHSKHLSGEAMDLIVPGRYAFTIAGRLLDAFSEIGACGVNPYLNYVHIDLRPKEEDKVLCFVYSKENRVV